MIRHSLLSALRAEFRLQMRNLTSRGKIIFLLFMISTIHLPSINNLYCLDESFEDLDHSLVSYKDYFQNFETFTIPDTVYRFCMHKDGFSGNMEFLFLLSLKVDYKGNVHEVQVSKVTNFRNNDLQSNHFTWKILEDSLKKISKKWKLKSVKSELDSLKNKISKDEFDKIGSIIRYDNALLLRDTNYMFLLRINVGGGHDYFNPFMLYKFLTKLDD